MSKLREAAEAVVAAWDSTSTSEMFRAMPRLRKALAEDALVRLSETHQQLGEQLGEVSPKIGEQLGEEYELIGTIDGTYAGRWMIAAFAENAAAVWPDGTAIYVRRMKE